MDILDGIELPDDVKAALQEKITSAYVSKDEFEAVRAKSNELLGDVKKAKQTKAEAEAEAERVRLDAATKAGDIESLRKSYEEKLAAVSENLTQLERKEKQNKLGNIASDFVGNHIVDDAFVREAMAVEFSKRLDVRDGEVVVLDPMGSLTALSIEDLKQEFLNNGKYAKQIIGSKASGGGATRADKGAEGSAQKSLSKIPLHDKAARIAALRKLLNT